jgi:crotonobetainyl-CoA:carnitine CoA-transferase CaiB-like acyl-CoA transferase
MKGVDATNNARFCELGADTDSVLLAAGYTSQQIAALREKGACG